MNAAQPVHKTTGERGPVLPGAIIACMWILSRDDWRDWTWEPVPTAFA